MLKILRRTLYSLAIFIGVLGLVIDGIPLVDYALEMLHNYEEHYYYDTHYLNEPEIIVLLSLILLVGVRIAMALDKKIQPASPLQTDSSAKTPAVALPVWASEAPGSQTETPDEKLTRLLNQKK